MTEKLNFDNLDPTDYMAIGEVIEQIGSEDGPLVELASGNNEYLRFLQEDAIAQLDLRVSPDDPDVQERAERTSSALAAYEAYLAQRDEPNSP